VNPGGDAGWDGPPLDIQVPDDARELERDILAYHREQRALRRRRRLRKIMPGQAGIMPLMASILAVCLVAGMMLSVFTITPTDGTSKTRPSTTQPATPRPSSSKPSSAASHSPTASASASGTPVPSPRAPGHTRPSGAPRTLPTR
jgi:hypothetical protein